MKRLALRARLLSPKHGIYKQVHFEHTEELAACPSCGAKVAGGAKSPIEN